MVRAVILARADRIGGKANMPNSARPDGVEVSSACFSDRAAQDGVPITSPGQRPLGRGLAANPHHGRDPVTEWVGNVASEQTRTLQAVGLLTGAWVKLGSRSQTQTRSPRHFPLRDEGER
jgi:hypothetical protein